MLLALSIKVKIKLESPSVALPIVACAGKAAAVNAKAATNAFN